MTDQVSAPTDSSNTLFELSEKARAHGLNPDRPFFPVNSLRLFYFLLIEEVTGNKEAVETMDRLIPKVEAFLSARNTAHLTHLNPAKELEECLPHLAEIQKEIDDFQFISFLKGLFTTTFPLHDKLLVNLSVRMNNPEAVTETDLELLLNCRAMDSIVFAEILKHLIQRYANGLEGEAANAQLQQALPWILQKVYILNDLIDCVVFAKDDLASQAFSPLSFIRIIAPEPATTKELITSTINKNVEEKNMFPLPEKISDILELFFNGLNSIIMG